VQKIFKAEEISVGDYVLTGGELPAMVLIDSISRQIPGVLGKYESLEEERVSTSEVYTRPEVLKYKNKNYKVPKVLLSGNHKKIEEWKNLTKN
jgi:tRNA (guanine37-N1)-methyltransferase